MPHVILKGKGWEGFNGLFGQYEFKDGRSVEDLPTLEASRLAAIAPIETEEGHNPSPSQQLIDMRDVRASDKRTTTRLVRDAESEKAAQKANECDSAVPTITREQLEAIADKRGINGLREVASEYGVTSKSIQGLIDGILAVAESKA